MFPKKSLKVLLSIFTITLLVGLGFRVALALNYIDFSGTDTQAIRWPAGQTLSFVQGGAERIRIDATTGNVVIPQGLTVSGTFSMTGTYTGSVSAGNISSGDFGSNYSGGNFSFPANVGIGTTGPGAKLEISGTSDALRFLVDDSNTVTLNTNVLDREAHLTLASGGNITLTPYSSAQNVVISQGNVGIGTTSPGAKLDVVGNIMLSGGNRLITADSSDGADNRYLAISGGGSAISSRGSYIYFQCNEDVSNPGKLILAAGNVATGDIVFRTGADDPKVTILANGNVGIGTTSPAQKLHIKGGDNTGLQINGSDYGEGYIKITGRDQNIGGTVSSFYHTIDVKMKTQGDNAGNGVETTIMQLFKEGWGGGDIVSFPRGNVGIGYTDTSGNKLAVNGAIYSPTSITAGTQLCIGASCQSSWASVGGGPWATSGNNIYNTNSGNVGIGTTGPLNKLHVSGNVEDNLVRLHNNSTTFNETSIRFRAQSPASENAHADFGFKATGSEVGYFFFKAPYSSTERMVVNTAGNVGIGTTGPSDKLYIIGNDNQITVDTVSEGAAGIFLRQAGVRQWELYDYQDKFHLYNYGTASDSITVLQSNGNVGIGTTGPYGKLSIVGTQGINNLVTI